MQLIPGLCSLSLYADTSSAFQYCQIAIANVSVAVLCRRGRIPDVVGLLMAGVVIGPQGRGDRQTLVPGWVALPGYSVRHVRSRYAIAARLRTCFTIMIFCCGYTVFRYVTTQAFLVV